MLLSTTATGKFQVATVKSTSFVHHLDQREARASKIKTATTWLGRKRGAAAPRKDPRHVVTYPRPVSCSNFLQEPTGLALTPGEGEVALGFTAALTHGCRGPSAAARRALPAGHCHRPGEEVLHDRRHFLSFTGTTTAPSELQRTIHTRPGLLPVAEARRVLGPYAERLRPLLAGHVAGLVGVPYLLAVIAELRLAAVPLAGQLGAAGAAVGNNRVAGEGRHPAS